VGLARSRRADRADELTDCADGLGPISRVS
jgi:hypothetical protein